jgi:hypothetical protein
VRILCRVIEERAAFLYRSACRGVQVSQNKALRRYLQQVEYPLSAVFRKSWDQSAIRLSVWPQIASQTTVD